MFTGKNKPAFDNIQTFIADGVTIRGDIVSPASLRIDGQVDGQIIAQGEVVIGEAGRVKGNIASRNLLIAGQVEGNVTSQGRIEITPAGKLLGDIECDTFIVKEGGKFLGRCQMNLDKQMGKIPTRNEHDTSLPRQER